MFHKFEIRFVYYPFFITETTTKVQEVPIQNDFLFVIINNKIN